MGSSPPIWLGIGKNSGGGPIDPAAIGTTTRRARLAAIRLDQTGGRRADTDMVEPKRHFLRSCVCYSEPAGFSRRGFIASAVGAGAAAATGLMPRRAAAQAKPSRIDVHHHFAPTFHRDALGSKRGGTWPTWSPQMSLDDMDKNGIATAMLS